MKILILYSYNKGYLSSFFFELSARLVNDGYEVVNFCLKGNSNAFSLNGIDIVIKKKGGYFSNYYQIYKLINNLKPDVILSNFSYVNPALIFGKLFRVKKNMVWFHSLNAQMESSFLDVFIKRHFLKLADMVIANSYLTKNELRDIYKVPENRLTAIPFWSSISESTATVVEDPNYISDENIFKIGCPGRMALHKNHRMVIEAVSQLQQAGFTDFKLYLAGDGDELADLKLLTKTLALEHRVVFLGQLSADEMITFYTSMDIITLPSLHEAFGLVFIEAIALGRPVLVSSAFGALDYIDTTKFSLKAFTFDPNSITHLKEQLIPYLAGQGLPSAYFKSLYKATYDKDLIYEKFKAVISAHY